MTQDAGSRPNGLPCGAFARQDGTVLWRVWAPVADSVELLLYADGAEPDAIAMQPEQRGHFVHSATNIAEGRRYAYRLDGGMPLPDPASRWQPDGVNHPSAVLFPERFSWSEGDWKGIRREELVIYELHVGTFTPEGTFDAVIPRLPELRDLGITALEIMPVAQFSGDRGWGYDGVHLFAVQNSYGGPQGFQRLIEACHRAGMAVLLDVVYNHVGPEGNYLGQFGPYFTGRYNTPWGQAVNFDDAGSDPVRTFVTQNVRQWVRDFRIDGLRLDAVHAIYDFSARHILRDIKEAAEDEARRLDRPVHVIAESSLNDVRLLDPPQRNGFGLDAQWSDDFHHCVHTLLTGERGGYYADFAQPPQQLAEALEQVFVYDGRYSPYRDRRHGASVGEHTGDRFVIFIQNHDQVGNRARGDRFGTLLTPAQQRLAAGLMLLAPHLPLIFMGEEYGETRPFPFFCSFQDPALIEAVRRGRRDEFASFAWKEHIPDPQAEETFESAKLNWEWPEGTWQAGMRRLYADLLAARRQWSALRDFVHRTARLVGRTSREVVRLTRGPSDSEDAVTVFFNLTDREQPLPADMPAGRTPRFISEDLRYGGSRAPDDSPRTLLPHEFQVF